MPKQVLGYAFVVVNKLVLHIAKVVVDASHRRNGIGSRLIKVPDIISLSVHFAQILLERAILCFYHLCAELLLD